MRTDANIGCCLHSLRTRISKDLPPHKSTMPGYVDVWCARQDQKLRDEGKCGSRLDTLGHLDLPGGGKGRVKELEDFVGHKVRLLVDK